MCIHHSPALLFFFGSSAEGIKGHVLTKVADEVYHQRQTEGKEEARVGTRILDLRLQFVSSKSKSFGLIKKICLRFV